MPETQYLKCPFCENRCIKPVVGKTCCVVCGASFEDDDRDECVFGNTDELRLPALGTICAHCGLIQAGEHHNIQVARRAVPHLKLMTEVNVIFADPENITLLASGMVCPAFGLIQSDKTKACLNCGLEINTAVH